MWLPQDSSVSPSGKLREKPGSGGGGIGDGIQCWVKILIDPQTITGESLCSCTVWNRLEGNRESADRDGGRLVDNSVKRAQRDESVQGLARVSSRSTGRGEKKGWR